MTIRINATIAATEIPRAGDYRRFLADEIIKGITRNVSRRFQRDELYAKHHRAMIADAAESGKACVATLAAY